MISAALKPRGLQRTVFLYVAVDFVGVFGNVLIRRQLSLWLVSQWESAWRLFGRVLPAILALPLRGVIFLFLSIALTVD